MAILDKARSLIRIISRWVFTSLGRDYWSMTDSQIYNLALKLNIKRHSLTHQLHKRETSDYANNPQFQISDSLRDEIIDELVNREMFGRNLVASVVSIAALIFSLLALVK